MTKKPHVGSREPNQHGERKVVKSRCTIVKRRRLVIIDVSSRCAAVVERDKVAGRRRPAGRRQGRRRAPPRVRRRRREVKLQPRSYREFRRDVDVRRRRAPPPGAPSAPARPCAAGHRLWRRRVFGRRRGRRPQVDAAGQKRSSTQAPTTSSLSTAAPIQTVSGD